MPTIKEINIGAGESGIGIQLGMKRVVLTDEDVDFLIKTLHELKPQVKKVKKERLTAELATFKQQVEDIENQLKNLKD